MSYFRLLKYGDDGINYNQNLNNGTIELQLILADFLKCSWLNYRKLVSKLWNSSDETNEREGRTNEWMNRRTGTDGRTSEWMGKWTDGTGRRTKEWVDEWVDGRTNVGDGLTKQRTGGWVGRRTYVRTDKLKGCRFGWTEMDAYVQGQRNDECSTIFQLDDGTWVEDKEQTLKIKADYVISAFGSTLADNEGIISFWLWLKFRQHIFKAFRYRPFSRDMYIPKLCAKKSDEELTCLACY